MIDNETKKRILCCPHWTTGDIALFFGVSRPTALKIKNRCKSCQIGNGKKYVKADDVLQMIANTTRRAEIDLLKNLEEKRTPQRSEVHPLKTIFILTKRKEKSKMEHFVERQLKNLEIELDFAKGSKKRKIKKEIKIFKYILKEYRFYKQEMNYKWEH